MKQFLIMTMLFISSICFAQKVAVVNYDYVVLNDTIKRGECVLIEQNSDNTYSMTYFISTKKTVFVDNINMVHYPSLYSRKSVNTVHDFLVKIEVPHINVYTNSTVYGKKDISSSRNISVNMGIYIVKDNIIGVDGNEYLCAIVNDKDIFIKYNKFSQIIYYNGGKTPERIKGKLTSDIIDKHGSLDPKIFKNINMYNAHITLTCASIGLGGIACLPSISNEARIGLCVGAGLSGIGAFVTHLVLHKQQIEINKSNAIKFTNNGVALSF